MKIRVTRQDIKQGEKRDPEQCAVALALIRAGINHFGVMGPSVMVPDAVGRLISLPLPAAVADWIFDFDAGKAVRPMAFELDVMPGSPPTQTSSWVVTQPDNPAQPSALLSPDNLNSISRIRSNARLKKPLINRSRQRNSFKNCRRASVAELV
jgi:hypothetical protein